MRTTGTRVLPDAPFGAQRQLLALVDDRRDERRDDVAPLRAAAAGRTRREAQA